MIFLNIDEEENGNVEYGGSPEDILNEYFDLTARLFHLFLKDCYDIMSEESLKKFSDNISNDLSSIIFNADEDVIIGKGYEDDEGEDDNEDEVEIEFVFE